MKILDSMISLVFKNGFIYKADTLNVSIPMKVSNSESDLEEVYALVTMENVTIQIKKDED